MIVLEGLGAPPYSSFDGATQHLQPEDVMFDAEFKVWVESVEHHLNKEEHEFLPEAKQVLGEDQILSERG